MRAPHPPTHTPGIKGKTVGLNLHESSVWKMVTREHLELLHCKARWGGAWYSWRAGGDSEAQHEGFLLVEGSVVLLDATTLI